MRARKRPFLLILLILVLSFTSQVFARDYLVLSEGLSLEPTKYLGKALDVVENRIKVWDDAFRKEDIGVKRLFSGPYGSGFLKLNKKGMDFDYMCVFDLGVLKEAPSKEQALELVTKINNIFRVIVKTNNTIPNTPTLYVYYSGPVDKDGNLVSIERARSVVEERLEAIKSNSKVKNAFYDLQGNLIPSDLYWFEVVLPVNTRVKIATDTVKYYQDMFSGIREVSIQFFYSVGIEKDGKIIYLNVSPLYDKAGSPIPFFDLMVNNVFLSTEDVRIYRERIMHLSEREIIVNNAKRMYLQSLINYQTGNYLKQLKRMHQCYYSLKWSFSSPEQSYIEAQ